MNRKDFVKTSGLAAAAMAIAPTGKLFANADRCKSKACYYWCWARGQSHLDLLLRRDDVELVAICDIDDRALNIQKKSSQRVVKKCRRFIQEIIMPGKKCWR